MKNAAGKISKNENWTPLTRMARRIMIACALIYQSYCMVCSRAPILLMSCLLSRVKGMSSYRPPSAHAEVATMGGWVRMR